MKQISARAFRVAFPRLTEPVTVSTRGEAGEIRILGTWTPAIPYRDTWADVPGQTPAIPYRDTWADVPGQTARTFTPVPKPRRKG